MAVVCYAAEIPAVGGWLHPSRDLGALLPLFSSMRRTMVRGIHTSRLRVLASRLVDSPPCCTVHFEAASPCCARPAERQSFLRHLSGWASDFSQRSYYQCWQDRESQNHRSSWHRSFATQIRKGKRGQKHLEGTDPSSDGASVREAALQAAIAQIEEAWGKETVMWMGRNTGRQDVAVISTGSLTLDIALGIGGVPRGRVIEIYGPEASGKTTLALHVIAEAQKAGGRCVFVDAEHALDQSFAERIGVDINNLLLSQPDTGEQALAITDTLIRSGSVDVVVVDSVAALVPKAELEGEMGDSHMALQARLMSQALRKLTHSVSRSQTTLIFINQIRSKLGTFGGFGAPQEVTSGGNALKFYASVRLNIRRTSLLKRGEETYGSQVIVKVAKNKLAPPFRTAEFEIEFDRGISREGEILDLGVKHGILGKSGAWFSYNKENFAMGKDNAKKHLRNNPEFRDKLLSIIKESVLDSGKSVSEPLVEEEDSDDDAPNEHFDEVEGA